MRYGDCTRPELIDYAHEGAVVLVPFGCTEQQGPHLPVDFDTWFAEDICSAAADRLAGRHITALVTPAVPFGPTPEHRNFHAGYVDLPKDVHDAIAKAVLTSLAEQGFRQLVVWRGCGGHDLHAVVDNFNHEWTNRARAVLPQAPLNLFWAELGAADVLGGHADSFATSISMYRRPDTVRAERIPQETSREPDWEDPQLDFAMYSTTGTIGNATAATKHRGELLAPMHPVGHRLRRTDPALSVENPCQPHGR